jgi:hypothetical protein
MNIQRLQHIQDTVRKGKFPLQHELLVNDDLCISTHANIPLTPDQLLILSEYAPQISWLIKELADVYEEELSRNLSHDFYYNIGEAANKAISDQKDVFDILESVIIASEEWSKLCTGGIFDVR